MRKYLRPSGWGALIVAIGLLAGCSGGPSLDIFNQSRSATAASPGVNIAEAKFAFAPVTGGPPEEISTLSKQIAQNAEAAGLTLVQQGDPSTTYLVKGYLSAVGGSSGTVVIYVWDVLDTSGARLHRISGQENSGASSGDPWAGVSNKTLSTIARDTVGQLAAWLRGR